MARVLILGAGGHGQVVADILLAAKRAGADDSASGFLDDDARLLGTTVLGLPVLGDTGQLLQVAHDAVIVAIGDNYTRQRLFARLREEGARFASAIHPTATIASNVRLGAGVVVCAGAVVGTGSVVGDGAIVNTACSVDHHNRIGAYAHICPGVHLGGEVSVDEGATIGIGGAVTPGRCVGAWAVIGAGGVVTTDIPPEHLAVGVPARVIRRVHNAEDTHCDRSSVRQAEDS